MWSEWRIRRKSGGLPGSRERYRRSTCSSEQRQRCRRRGLNEKNKAQISRSRSGLRQLVELQGFALLVVAHGQFGRDGLEVTKEAACAVVGAGGEIEFGARRASGVVTSGGGAVAGAESPEAANGDRLSGCILDQADELTCGEIVGGNGAGTIRRSGAGELAYEQIVAKDAEVERRKSYAPGRIEPISVFEAFKELTIGGEDVDVPETGAISFQGIAFLVEDEGDDDVVTDGLNVEGHEVPRKTIVGEGLFVFGAVVPVGICIPAWLQSDFVEGVVVDVDRAFVEVGGVEVALAVDGGAGEAGVAGSVGGFYHHHGVRGRRRCAAGYSDGRVPSGDGAVNSGEKKIRGRARGQQEISGAGIGDGARRSPRGEGLAGGVCFRNGHDEWIDRPSAVVERTQASAVVGDPPRAAGSARDSPGIDQIGVRDGGYA